MNFIDNNLNKKRYTIVDDVNNGVIINDNFTQFEWIKTKEDFKAWQEITYNTLFGISLVWWVSKNYNYIFTVMINIFVSSQIEFT